MTRRIPVFDRYSADAQILPRSGYSIVALSGQIIFFNFPSFVTFNINKTIFCFAFVYCFSDICGKKII